MSAAGGSSNLYARYDLGSNRPRKHSSLHPILAPGDPNAFPFTCAFENGKHVSGWKVEIVLDTEGRRREQPWRSGETMRGNVVLSRSPFYSTSTTSEPQPQIQSCVLRSFWQSTTIYSIAKPSTSAMHLHKFQGYHQGAIIEQHKAEWHRGDINAGGIELWHGGELHSIRNDVEFDFPLLDDAPPTAILPRVSTSTTTESNTTLPFSLLLPTSTSATTCNTGETKMPIDRESLRQFIRSPPPTLSCSDCCTGCVESVIEVLLTLEDGSTLNVTTNDILPSFNDRRDNSPAVAEGGLLFSTESLLVHRILFPFEPLDRDVQDLYSSWSPNERNTSNSPEDEDVVQQRIENHGAVPSFGTDVRNEILGGSLICGKNRIEGRSLIGDESRWSSYLTRSAARNVFGREIAFILGEASIPFPAILTRRSNTIPFIVHLEHSLLDSNKKAKPIPIDKVVCVLSVRTSTRGGKDTRPTRLLEELRREEIKIWNDAMEEKDDLMIRRSGKREEVEDGKRHLLLEMNGSVDFRVEFDLQSGGMMNGKKLASLAGERISFRTPNIEREYLVSVSVHFIGEDSICLLRVPVQVIAGDDQLPGFDHSQASAEIDDDGLPAY